VTGRSDRGSTIIIAVPVISAEKVVAVVRAAESSAEVWRQVASAWTGMGAAALTALAVAVLVARRQAENLTRPLELLSRTAGQVADGVLSARAPASRIPEIDQLGRAQNAMVDGLSAALDRERHLAADASHQLRTPLAGLQLQLESALHERPDDIWPILKKALSDVQRLHATVEDLLALARLDANRNTILALRQPVSDVIQRMDDRWHGSLAEEGRQLRLSVDHEVQTLAVPGVVGHVLDALLENALTHGVGTVSVMVREAVDALAITVTDEGQLADSVADPFERGATGDGGTGIGLALARTMTEAVGGRLLMVARSPMSIALFLPPETL
jgi:signal transduction histidine kinase